MKQNTLSSIFILIPERPKIEANALNIKAFEIEKRAAMCLLENKDKEPTRSVLFRSAANLAYGCGMFQEAEEMALHGLDGNPPDEIKDELNEVLKVAIDGAKL